MDFATPRAGFLDAGLDEITKAFQIPFDPRANRPERRTHVLDDALGVILHAHCHVRAICCDWPETHDAGVRRPAGTAPGDLFVGHLLKNLSVPLFAFARDLRDPTQAL